MTGDCLLYIFHSFGGCPHYVVETRKAPNFTAVLGYWTILCVAVISYHLIPHHLKSQDFIAHFNVLGYKTNDPKFMVLNKV